MTHGPNVNRLIAMKAARDMTPPGSDLGTVVSAIMGGKLGQAAREAEAWVAEAIGVVRLACDPNPWKTASDEEIAAELLRKIDARKAVRP